MKNHLLNLNKLFLINSFLFLLISGCKKADYRYYTEADRTIKISDNILSDNGFVIKNRIFNLSKYDDFLKYISSSDHFLIVPLKDFKKTTSTDKVVISLRYDIDANINAAIKFAYREHKYGLKSTYFILHTADYYGKITGSSFQRNPQIIYYLKKIQNDFGHEIGFHNDLVTLQIVYGISPKEFLKNELAYLRGNKINIVGTAYHGSPYCYIYKYYNAYFWNEYPDNGWNYEYVTKNNVAIKIEKDDLSNYNFEYEGGLMGQDYFFADCFFIEGKRWNPNMVNLDTIKKGKKVIILFHPELWD
jgi:hypothetical protein